MIKTAIQLKAKIRNVSGGDSKVAMTMIRVFFMERFLERVSMSVYRNQFVLKGGIALEDNVSFEIKSIETIMDEIDKCTKA